MELSDWIANLKTVIDGLDLIDPELLPPSFGDEVLAPVLSGRDHLGTLELMQQCHQLVLNLARLGEEACRRDWFLWEKAGTLLADFASAEYCLFFRKGNESNLFKIHPLETEEENMDYQWPRDADANLVAVKPDGFQQGAMLQLGQQKNFPLVLLFRSVAPMPRISMAHLSGLEQMEALLYRIFAAHFPKKDYTRTLEIVGDPIEEEHGKILGRDLSFLKVLEEVKHAAGSDATVYFKGESGTGKELFARHLHDLSDRRDGPFIPINCSAIPNELIESEMFGHEKGAFTGAYFRKIGKAEQANGGTLFLDEIGEMPVAFQAKLLRYLQEKKFSRVGGNNQVHSDARIVVATHRDLKSMVEDKTFREDLYYRVHVIPILIPPLRERGRDIRYLAECFFQKYIGKSRASRRQVDEAVFDVLERYPFPGNVRELDNIIQRTVVMTQKPVISVEELPEDLFKTDRGNYDLYRLHPFEKLDKHLPRDRETLRNLKKEAEHVAFSYQRDLDRRFLLHLLETNNGSARKAAEAADINRTLFYKLLKRAGLDISILNKSDS